VPRAIGIDPSSFWQWMQESSKMENPRFKFEWGGSIDWLHSHYQTARRRNIVLLEGHLRDVLQVGHETVVVHNGQVSYELNPDYLDWSDEDFRTFCVDPKQRYVLDELGRPKVLTVHTAPPAHLLIRGASAYLPAWKESKTLDVNSRVSGGVMVLTGKAPETPLKKLAAPLPASDEDAAIDRSGDSELVRDLRARLRAGVKQPRPLAHVPAAPDDDVPDDEGDLPRRAAAMADEFNHRPHAAPASLPVIPSTPRPMRERDDALPEPDPHMIAGARGFKVL
jgi:hypothetical protein